MDLEGAIDRVSPGCRLTFRGSEMAVRSLSVCSIEEDGARLVFAAPWAGAQRVDNGSILVARNEAGPPVVIRVGSAAELVVDLPEHAWVVLEYAALVGRVPGQVLPALVPEEPADGDGARIALHQFATEAWQAEPRAARLSELRKSLAGGVGPSVEVATPARGGIELATETVAQRRYRCTVGSKVAIEFRSPLPLHESAEQLEFALHGGLQRSQAWNVAAGQASYRLDIRGGMIYGQVAWPEWADSKLNTYRILRRVTKGSFVYMPVIAEGKLGTRDFVFGPFASGVMQVQFRTAQRDGSKEMFLNIPVDLAEGEVRVLGEVRPETVTTFHFGEVRPDGGDLVIRGAPGGNAWQEQGAIDFTLRAAAGRSYELHGLAAGCVYEILQRGMQLGDGRILEHKVRFEARGASEVRFESRYAKDAMVRVLVAADRPLAAAGMRMQFFEHGDPAASGDEPRRVRQGRSGDGAVEETWRMPPGDYTWVAVAEGADGPLAASGVIGVGESGLELPVRLSAAATVQISVPDEPPFDQQCTIGIGVEGSGRVFASARLGPAVANPGGNAQRGGVPVRFAVPASCRVEVRASVRGRMVATVDLTTPGAGQNTEVKAGDWRHD